MGRAAARPRPGGLAAVVLRAPRRRGGRGGRVVRVGFRFPSGRAGRRRPRRVLQPLRAAVPAQPTAAVDDRRDGGDGRPHRARGSRSSGTARRARRALGADGVPRDQPSAPRDDGGVGGPRVGGDRRHGRRRRPASRRVAPARGRAMGRGVQPVVAGPVRRNAPEPGHRLRGPGADERARLVVDADPREPRERREPVDALGLELPRVLPLRGLDRPLDLVAAQVRPAGSRLRVARPGLARAAPWGGHPGGPGRDAGVPGEGAEPAAGRRQPVPVRPRAGHVAAPRADEQGRPGPGPVLRDDDRDLARGRARLRGEGEGVAPGARGRDRRAARDRLARLRVPAVDRAGDPGRAARPSAGARAGAVGLAAGGRPAQRGPRRRQGARAAARRLLSDAHDVGVLRGRPDPAVPAHAPDDPAAARVVLR